VCSPPYRYSRIAQTSSTPSPGVSPRSVWPPGTGQP